MTTDFSPSGIHGLHVRNYTIKIAPYLQWWSIRVAYGSCRVSDQGTILRASDLHNAQATILNPFNKDMQFSVIQCQLTRHSPVQHKSPSDILLNVRIL